VAEGVETVEHTAMLCSLECDQAQGYYFAKALSPEAAETFILKRPQKIAAATAAVPVAAN
jgi:EAL domain-containing protein (putative c-di-GMP-specific phosphodiesterase class I)